MIKVLYIGGDSNVIPKISDSEIKIDHVQNGMIALSAIQTQDYNVVIIENQLPLMKPNRLIKEFRSQKLEVPLICIVRDDPRRLQILDEIE